MLDLKWEKENLSSVWDRVGEVQKLVQKTLADENMKAILIWDLVSQNKFLATIQIGKYSEQFVCSMHYPDEWQEIINRTLNLLGRKVLREIGKR